jgi:hypothetical protein
MGPAFVLNMDETPVSMVDAPVTAVVATGSAIAGKIHTTGNPRLNVTTFSCISAAEHKLPLGAILKGKTVRCLKKIRDGASDELKRVRLYPSEKSWMNESIMLQWLRDVVQPYTRTSSAALIFDSYAAHFTPAVQAAAMCMNLNLIQVPGGCTSELQPLDAGFNGPMLKKRKQIWALHKLLSPSSVDFPQQVIKRAQASYSAMVTRTAHAAF